MASLTELIKQKESLNATKYGNQNKTTTNISDVFLSKINQTLGTIYPLREGIDNPPVNNGQRSQQFVDTKKQMQSQHDDVNQMKIQHEELRLEMDYLRNKNVNIVQNYVDSASVNNPYSGKYVVINNNIVGYVTQKGVFKQISKDSVQQRDIMGKNGCPVASENNIMHINIPSIQKDADFAFNTFIPSEPPLLVGSPMVEGQGCGNEGKNVYVDSIIQEPKTEYVGCYNDRPPSKDIAIVPTMNQSNNVNGFVSEASSIYSGNNGFVGPWAAFDNNPNTFWHTADNLYNTNTGEYQGQNSKEFVQKFGGIVTKKGEELRILLPNDAILTSYSLLGRGDCCGDPNPRDPNTWYILGLSSKDNQWHQVDYRENEELGGKKKNFQTNNANAYKGYSIFVLRTGSSKARSNRISLQIAEWVLISNNGAWMTDDKRAMVWQPENIGNATWEECRDYAIRNEYSLFGLQYAQNNGTAQCMMSNDITHTQMYGQVVNNGTLLPIWSSNTTGKNVSQAVVNKDGTFSLLENNGTKVWNAGTPDPSCINGGNVNPSSISATYGANCNSKANANANKNPFTNVNKWFKKNTESFENISQNNVGEKVKNMYEEHNKSNSSSQFMVDVNNNTFGDPAVGCPKSWDTAYQCGNAWKSGHYDMGEGRSYLYNCSKEINDCDFILQLLDDGTLYIQKSVSSNRTIIANNNNTDGISNPEWEASKGKFGRNYLQSGEVLFPNEWIGSNNGKYKLIMQNDGNLVLYTYKKNETCQKLGKTENMAGGSWMNAVYKILEKGFANNVGKVGYITNNDELKPYPSSMLTFSGNNFLHIPDTNIQGYDITKPIIVKDIEEARKKCLDNKSCAGFVYNNDTKMCWLKNADILEKGKRSVSKGYDTYFRRPNINAPESINPIIINVDSIQYQKYPGSGDMNFNYKEQGQGQIKESMSTLRENMDTMNKNYTPSLSFLKSIDQQQIDQLGSRMNILGSEINNRTREIQNENVKANKKVIKNSATIKKNSHEWSEVNEKIKRVDLNNMTNILNDSDIRMMQQSERYMILSLVTLGLVIVTINNI